MYFDSDDTSDAAAQTMHTANLSAITDIEGALDSGWAPTLSTGDTRDKLLIRHWGCEQVLERGYT